VAILNERVDSIGEARRVTITEFRSGVSLGIGSQLRKQRDQQRRFDICIGMYEAVASGRSSENDVHIILIQYVFSANELHFL
jgi:hypothetical protein